eukprot:PLAT10387.1.p1 GENE.PLAT10387.1~~PLAT10387.1.p1  ORF type:complete len:295 (-),score=124.96 PLAT10387.1:120-1004(-)
MESRVRRKRKASEVDDEAASSDAAGGAGHGQPPAKRAAVRDSSYDLRLRLLAEEEASVRDGSHAEFVERSKAVEEEHTRRLALAHFYHNFRLTHLHRMLRFEEEAAAEVRKASLAELRATMLSSIEDKRKSLQELRGAGSASTSSGTTRKLRSKSRDSGHDAGSSGSSDHGSGRSRRSADKGLTYRLTEEEIFGDLKTIRDDWLAHARKYNEKHGVDSIAVDVDRDRGKLVYRDSTFTRGDAVIVHSSFSNEDFYGTLRAVNALEIYVRLLDGSKTRVYLSQLRNGRCTIRHQR